MSLTAFLPTGAPQILPFIGTPGAATVGYALVWSESPQGFNLAPIAVGPDQFTGVLPISKGGTGTATGSIAAPVNTNLALSFSGSAAFQLNQSGINRFGIKSEGIIHFFGEPIPDVNLPFQIRAGGGIGYLSVNDGENYAALIGYDRSNTAFDGVVIRNVKAGSGPGADINLVVSNTTRAVKISGSSDVIFYSTTASSSTTTGAVRIDGGLGVAGSIYNGGNLIASGAKINFQNLPTSDTGLAVGDLWRDGNTVKVKT